MWLFWYITMDMVQFHVWSKNAKSRHYRSCLESAILEIASRLNIHYGVNQLSKSIAISNFDSWLLVYRFHFAQWSRPRVTIIFFYSCTIDYWCHGCRFTGCRWHAGFARIQFWGCQILRIRNFALSGSHLVVAVNGDSKQQAVGPD